mgnify:FL=1
MKTQQEIQQMLQACGAMDFFGTKKEVKELPNVIQDDEIITYATSGMLNGNTWLIVSTNKRVIFLDKGMIFGLKQVEIPLDKINSISYKKGLLLGEITIWDGAAPMGITAVTKQTLVPFVEAVNKSREELNHSRTKSASPQLSAADEILKFKSLLDQGILTQEEFDKKKKELLG